MIQRTLVQRAFIAVFAILFGPALFAQEAETETEYRVVVETEREIPVETGYRIVKERVADFVTTLAVGYAQENFWTGLHLSPVDPALRTQLELDENEGVVVTGIESGSPAEEAGIQVHDLLLTVSGEPVTDTDTFIERIQESDEGGIVIVLLRGGKRLSLDMKPTHREWDVVTYFAGDQYRIGVGVADLDESLRAQLGLTDGLGLVITDVHEDSPAAEAGIALHDIILEFGGKPLASVEDLTSQIQEVGDHTATVNLIRNGERQSVRVTPERQVNEQSYINWVEADVLGYHYLNIDAATGEVIAELTFEEPQQPGTEEQLEELIQEMQDLTERMEALQHLIQAEAAGAATDEEEAAGGAGDGD